MEKTICEMVSAVAYNGKLVCSENILENPYEFEKPILMALPHFAKSNIIFYHHKGPYPISYEFWPFSYSNNVNTFGLSK